GLDHAHDQAKHTGAVGATVDEVADEHGGASLGVVRVDGAVLTVPGEGVPEVFDECRQLASAAVHVTDDVERPVELPLVGPGAFQFDDGTVDLLLPPQDVHLADAFTLQTFQASLEVSSLPVDHVVAEVAFGASPVAFDGHGRRHVEDDRRGQDVVVLGHTDKFLSGPALDVGGVHDGEQTTPQTHVDDGAHQGEGVGGGALVVGVVADHAPALVGADDLGGQEVLGGEGGLAGPGDPDQEDKSHPRHAEHTGHVGLGLLCRAHLVTTPIWVGAPVSGSSSPTGR